MIWIRKGLSKEDRIVFNQEAKEDLKDISPAALLLSLGLFSPQFTNYSLPGPWFDLSKPRETQTFPKAIL